MKSKWPIGVFASIDAGLGVKLEVARELGVSTIQLHAPAAASRTPARAREFLATLADLGISLTAVFGGFEGESYADIPTVVRTVGLVPPATRTERVREMKQIADFARLLEVDVVGAALGLCAARRGRSALSRGARRHARPLRPLPDATGRTCTWKPGRSRPIVCCDFCTTSERNNLFVNFDPANMILYGSGEPIAALEKIGSLVRSVHCKDARWAAHPGEEWGTEVPLGRGTSAWSDICARSTRSATTAP